MKKQIRPPSHIVAPVPVRRPFHSMSSKLCQERGWRVQFIKDEGEGGKHTQRPGLSDILEA